MKLYSIVAIWIVAGLAVEGITRNLECRSETRTRSVGHPARISTGKSFGNQLPPLAEGVQPAANDLPPQARLDDLAGPLTPTDDPVVDEILRIRQDLGGSSVASILATGNPGERATYQASFQQAVSELASKIPDRRSTAGPDQSESPARTARIRQLVGELRQAAIQMQTSESLLLRARAERYGCLCDSLDQLIRDYEKGMGDQAQTKLPQPGPVDSEQPR